MKKIATRLISSLLLVIMIAVCIPSTFELKANAISNDINTYAPVFNASFYASHNSDVVAVYGNDTNSLFNHFLNFGMKEGRQGSEEFNVQAYKTRYADLRAVFGDDLRAYYIHYIEFGKGEGRNGRADVSTTINNSANISSRTVNDVVTQVTGYNGSAASYFDKAVFVGDSIMVGYRSYAATNANSVAHASDFLCNVSYSLYNAFAPVSASSLHPTYLGEKRFVWDSIALMDVDKVFIMFGTNDLVCYSPEQIIAKYQSFIDNIVAAKPGVQIHIISMTPVYAGTNKGCLNNANIDTLNALLMQMCQSKGYGFVNLNAGLRDASGNMNPAYSSDRYVHHNNTAYANVWESTLANYASQH